MAWGQVTNLRGPAGEQGPQGPQGIQGIAGPAGEDGAGIEIAGSVATYAELPTGLGPGDEGDGYLVEADGKLYIWSGTAWSAGVEFRGPAGPAGPQGETGPAGGEGVQGPAGAQGPQGPRGTAWFTGTGAPTSIVGSQANDLYLDLSDGTVYRLNP